MQIRDLETLFGQHPQVKAINERLAVRGDKHVLITGLHASARALALAQVGQPFFVIFDNAEAAQYLYADLRSLESRVLFFPSSRRRRSIDDAAVIQRTECLTALVESQKSKDKRLIIVTYPEAVAEPVPAKEELSAVSFQLSVGQSIQQSALSHQLSELGFEHMDFVFQPGQYAVRGSIVDIYSYSHDNPYRIDFFGNEIESIREFDIEDQLSKSRVENAEIVGSQPSAVSNQHSVTDYLGEETVWVSNDWSVVRFKLDGLGVDSRKSKVESRKTIEIAEKSTFAEHTKISFDTVPQPVFHKQFDILTEDLRKHIDDGYKIYILAEQTKQLDRLKAIFEAQDANISFIG